MHLVGFTIEIRYDARSYKLQSSKLTPCLDKMIHAISDSDFVCFFKDKYHSMEAFIHSCSVSVGPRHSSPIIISFIIFFFFYGFRGRSISPLFNGPQIYSMLSLYKRK